MTDSESSDFDYGDFREQQRNKNKLLFKKSRICNEVDNMWKIMFDDDCQNFNDDIKIFPYEIIQFLTKLDPKILKLLKLNELVKNLKEFKFNFAVETDGEDYRDYYLSDVEYDNITEINTEEEKILNRQFKNWEDDFDCDGKEAYYNGNYSDFVDMEDDYDGSFYKYYECKVFYTTIEVVNNLFPNNNDYNHYDLFRYLYCFSNCKNIQLWMYLYQYFNNKGLPNEVISIIFEYCNVNQHNEFYDCDLYFNMILFCINFRNTLTL